MLDRHYRFILDESPEGVLIEARDRIAYLNQSFARMLGYRESLDLSGATVRDIAHPEDQDRLIYYGRCRQDRKPAPSSYQFRVCRRDGSLARFDARVWASRVPGEMLITTMVHRVIDDEGKAIRPVDGVEVLSPREKQIFEGLLAGRRAKEIAFELGISEKTVATHRSRVYQKLCFRSDLDMFRFAAQHGLLDD